MSTDAQIKANRKNAKKSTGPKTPEGKAKSAQNATTHGLTASHDVIKGESQEEFDAHKKGFLDALKPTDAVEEFLADRVVSLSWRLKRAERIHNQIYNCMLADHNFDTLGYIMKKYTTMWGDIRAYPSTQDPDLNLGAVVRRDYKTENILHRFLVYERRIESSALKCLRELKRKKRQEPSSTAGLAPPSQSSNLCPRGSGVTNQTQFPQPETSAISMESELYNLCSHRIKPQSEPNNTPPGDTQPPPRPAYRSGTRRY